MENIPAEAKGIIGRESSHVYEVTERDIRRYAQAVDDDNLLYTDDLYAKETRFGGIIAPPLFCHTCAFNDVPASQLREDGLPKELEVPLPTTRTVGGGSVFEVGEPVRPGDVLTVTVRIVNLIKKIGKSGPLYFITVETTCNNQNNQLVAREEAIFIHR